MSDKNIFGLHHNGELTRGETNEMVPPVCDRIEIVRTAAHDTLAREISSMPFNPQEHIDALVKASMAAPVSPQPKYYSPPAQPVPTSLVRAEADNDGFAEGLGGATWVGDRPSDAQIKQANEAALTAGSGMISRLVSRVSGERPLPASPVVEVGMYGPTPADQYIHGITTQPEQLAASGSVSQAEIEPVATITDLAAARYARQAQEKQLAELRHNVVVARGAGSVAA